jgi:hypothetical protein
MCNYLTRVVAESQFLLSNDSPVFEFAGWIKIPMGYFFTINNEQLAISNRKAITNDKLQMTNQ